MSQVDRQTDRQTYRQTDRKEKKEREERQKEIGYERSRHTDIQKGKKGRRYKQSRQT